MPLSPYHFIDSHCHIDFEVFDEDRHKILENCRSLLVSDIVVPGTEVSQWSRAIDLGHQFPQLHIALGLHPLFLKNHSASAVSLLEAQLDSSRDVVAIGEIGLDFYHDHSDQKQQLDLFQQQVDLAEQFKLPLLLHVRKAHQQVLNLVRHYPYGGIVHAFSGSLEQARQYFGYGFLIGVGGVVTRKNALKLRRTVEHLPLESLVLETDAPDLPPVWARGERNSPEQIPAIAQVVADLRNQPLEEVAVRTTANVMRCLNLNG